MDVLDVKFHPTDAKKCVAGARGGQAFVSEDGGVTWKKAAGITPVASTFSGAVGWCEYRPSSMPR